MRSRVYFLGAYLYVLGGQGGPMAYLCGESLMNMSGSRERV